MKRTFKSFNIILLVLLLGFIYSCSDDFFETSAGKRVKPEDHYQYNIDAENSYFGCFSYMQDIVGNLVLVDGLRSDMMDTTQNSDKDMIDIFNHDLSVDNPYLDFSNFYKVIVNVNEVIPHLPGILEKDRDFDSTVLNSYTSALVTLRSWCYFMIAKLNNEAYIINDDLTSIEKPEYLSKNAVIDRLISELLPYYDEEDISRAPTVIIEYHALLGELYLEKNNYTEAAFYLKRCVDGPGNPGGERSPVYLVSDSYEDDNWIGIFFNSENQGETVITAVPFNYEKDQPNLLPLWMTYNYNYMVKPSVTIMNSFESQIQAKNDTGDIYRGLGVSYFKFEDAPYITKYSYDQVLSADVILYRDADIHLMLAEALNRLGDTLIPLSLLNNGLSQIQELPEEFSAWTDNVGVRGRVSLKPVTGNTVEEIEDLIIQERAMELAFEGKRWFDLVRIANRRGNPAYLADRVAAKYTDPAKAAEIRAKLMNTNNWYLSLQEQ